MVAALAPGVALGPYVLLRPIGRGASAQVWVARFECGPGVARLVALKTALSEYAADARFARMLLEEARLLAAVTHPNVCQIYEVAEERGRLLLALEWIDGASLEAMLTASGTRTALDPPIAARLVADACAGLHALHEARDSRGRALAIVHRDVSPQNILLTASGFAKVSDFGIAKARDERRARTRSGRIKGKYAYLSPEQITGAPLDRRTDVFAMGAVLYAACVGALAFPADRSALTRVPRGDYTPPRALRPDLPQTLAQIIERALEPELAARTPSADALRTDLEEWLLREAGLVRTEDVAAALKARLGKVIDSRNAAIRRASRESAPPHTQSTLLAWLRRLR